MNCALWDPAMKPAPLLCLSVTNKQTLAKQEPTYFLSKTEKPTAARIISTRLHHDSETAKYRLGYSRRVCTYSGRVQ